MPGQKGKGKKPTNISKSGNVYRGRRAYDPRKSLKTLSTMVELPNIPPNTQFGSSVALLILIYLMNNMKKKHQQPVVERVYYNKDHKQFTKEELDLQPPEIKSLDDFKKWISSIKSFNEHGYCIVSVNGCTGNGTIVSRGSDCGQVVRVNTTNLKIQDRKGRHIFFCSYSSTDTVHMELDLTDPFMVDVEETLRSLDIILESTSSNKISDDSIQMYTVDSGGNQKSYWVTVGAAQLINKKLEFSRPKHKKQSKAKTQPQPQSQKSYLDDFDLPPSDSDHEDYQYTDEEEDM